MQAEITKSWFGLCNDLVKESRSSLRFSVVFLRVNAGHKGSDYFRGFLADIRTTALWVSTHSNFFSEWKMELATMKAAWQTECNTI